MKKFIFSLGISIIGFLWFSTLFAQENYTDCTANGDGWFFCQQYQTCNNPDWYCFCTPTSLSIPHNTTCFSNANYLIKNRIVSSYAISGSLVSFKLTIANTQSTDKHFFLRLPIFGFNPRIKIIDLTTEWLTNEWLIAMYNWFANPQYFIPANTSKTIIITGQVVSSSYVFDRIDITPCVTNIWSTYCIESTPTFIFPIANYSIQQRILDPKPIFSWENANYEIIVKSNGSKVGGAISLSSNLGNPLGNISLNYWWVAVSSSSQDGQRYVRENIFSSLTPGESKTIIMTWKFTADPEALSKITTTSTLLDWRELQLSDNTATTEFVVPAVVDIVLDKIEKISWDPEIANDTIGFEITYHSTWNTWARNVSLNAVISWTNLLQKRINLPNLPKNTENKIILTWLVNQTYSPWTQLCFSWRINATNESETKENNTLAPVCYTFVKSADVVITATLENTNLSALNKWSTLNYVVTLKNVWEKTATGISLNIFWSSNQEISWNTALTGISLSWGETKIINITSTLANYPLQWTTIVLSGVSHFGGIDLDQSNNSFSLSTELPWLSDAWIDIQTSSFSGFRVGDEISYTISYGNSWYAPALTPKIIITKPAFLDISKTEWDLWASLVSGAHGSISITGRLNQLLEARSQITTQAKIEITSAQTTTGNDSDEVISLAWELNSISFGSALYNNTRPSLTINPQSNIQAVSGDIIAFIVTYNNAGNVPANNVSISLTNVWPIALQQYNQTIGTIWIGQQGSFTITGRITNANYISTNPTLTLSYNTTWTSRNFSVEEPYLCGDGLLTRNEICEVEWQLNVGPGQRCVNQQWTCSLLTESIVNRACAEFWPNMANSVCAEVPLTLTQASCYALDVSPINTTSATARCIGQSTRPFTPVSINCGNGNILSGVAWPSGIFNWTCSYASSGEAQRAILSCAVANDINNANCRKWITSCNINLDSNLLILEENEESVLVQCSTSNWQEAALEIDCWNNTYSRRENWSSIQHRCEFSQNDLSINSSSRIMNIQCKVNGINSCNSDLILDKWIMGACGDGIRQWYEQCDLPNGTKIELFLDSTRTTWTPWDLIGKNKVCNNCAIEGETPAQCLSVHNGNVSIEKGEVLPIWWRVHEDSFAGTTDCSRSSDEGKIIASTMQCTFELQKPGGDIKTLLTRECISNPNESVYPIFSFFKQYMSSSAWKYAIRPDLFNNWIGNNFWEYKIRLSSVEYDYCQNNERVSSISDNVCESNLAITKPYLVQKSAFWMNPKATNIDLRDFEDINGNPIIDRTDLADIMILDPNEYAGYNEVSPLIDTFVANVEKLAVSTKLPAWLKWSNITAKKIPNKDIYILKWGDFITLTKDVKITKPFTLIVKDATLIINGNIDVNGMFITQKWLIRFDDTSCNGQQTVKWIFVSKNGFAATKNINDSLNKAWCNAWWLHVKWVLIGDITNLVTNKRSNLSSWFRVSWSENTIKAQRRNMIFNWASVLIEYSPELWQQLPPGADEFTKTLEVYKR